MRIKIIVEYDGTNYQGWQVQPGGVTIQLRLEEALHKLTGQTIRVTGAGRTDAGVHAKGQTAAFDCDTPIPIEQFARAMNSRLPKDIAVKHACYVPDCFNPRKDCVQKQYVYSILVSPLRPAFCRQVWHIPWELDAQIMQEAARIFVGTHSFHAFCKKRDRHVEEEDVIRTITRCEFLCEKEAPPAGVSESEWEFIYRSPWRGWLVIEGRSFLYAMVRSIMGALVEVGKGKVSLRELETLFSPSHKGRFPFCAPAEGLCLEWVRYE